MITVVSPTTPFLLLLRSGLWEEEVRLGAVAPVDWAAVCRLASQQAVVGLVAAGLEHVADGQPPREAVAPFMAAVLSVERCNAEMNVFIAGLSRQMEEAGIRALLVKGQGVAQCYERPLWRSCGDVDLLLTPEEYRKAKELLLPQAQKVEEEYARRLHLGMLIPPWKVELHGTLRAVLWRRMDAGLDAVQREMFAQGRFRVWRNGAADVLLPAADEDVVFVFCHILQHFFKGGIGLRQICDWCRLLWTFRAELDRGRLEERIRAMGALSEWRAFASLAVQWLGIPAEAMPLYSDAPRWSRKAGRILRFVLETGNFGRNRDTSYITRRPYLVRKVISFSRHTADAFPRFLIFPRDSFAPWWRMLVTGLAALGKR